METHNIALGSTIQGKYADAISMKMGNLKIENKPASKSELSLWAVLMFKNSCA